MPIKIKDQMFFCKSTDKNSVIVMLLHKMKLVDKTEQGLKQPVELEQCLKFNLFS